ncbi:hypothetical protein RRG08_041781 [Elysia crispata]|uniref:Uncharacterized protein n=1 Tax=Elysia crispata TaxID=231223 RepID=A0AAE1CZQ3_9GAST|nr:hypothetical protein RRG08_041781 [Elysia crispata]
MVLECFRDQGKPRVYTATQVHLCQVDSFLPLETIESFDALIDAPNGILCKSRVNVLKQKPKPILEWPVCRGLNVLTAQDMEPS